MILYGDPASVFVHKPFVLLLEKQIRFVNDPITLYDYVNVAFLNASPLKKIPAIKDGKFMLADSSAICAYLERKYPTPGFYPNDAQDYAQALWFEEYADTVLFTALAPIYYQKVLAPLYGRQTNLHAIETALNKQLPPVATFLDSQLIKKNYLVNNSFTIADVSVVSMFLNMDAVGFSLNKTTWPHLSAYLQHHFQRVSFKACQQAVKRALTKAQKINAACN
ncbi:Stringent starvation protein A [Legionella busanensis]|uniref:Stringent starvation protein A n=1 Tax=Legionella busanensis TaxID=190655 RepID=A0A378JJN6_9GAMM|nr:glutathione S-transferase family protein [Legionella busanensis]STX51435.1 Stringent starvation protein A [Legionella busanensis]